MRHTMELGETLRIALFATVAAVAFVAFLDPTRNKAVRVVSGLLTRRDWMPAYPNRAQLLFVCILFSVIAVVALYLALTP